jgi:hypothetical protein
MVSISKCSAVTANVPNPYQPPKSRVDDVSSARELLPQPTTVLIAVILLSIKLAIDVMVDLTTLQDKPEFARIPLVVSVAIVCALVLVVVWLIWKINSARHWARITYLIVLSCGFLVFAVRLAAGMGEPFQLTIGKLVESLLPIVAMVLLFTPSANAWFRQGRRN